MTAVNSLSCYCKQMPSRSCLTTSLRRWIAYANVQLEA